MQTWKKCNKKENPSKHFQSRYYLQIGVSSPLGPQQNCMTMILNLDALQLNVSPFGRKYLQNNEIHDMAWLRTIASKTQPSQLKVH